MIDFKCNCSAITRIGNLAREECEPLLFIGSSVKSGYGKTNLEYKHPLKCLWCGSAFPDNLKDLLEKSRIFG